MIRGGAVLLVELRLGRRLRGLGSVDPRRGRACGACGASPPVLGLFGFVCFLLQLVIYGLNRLW
eukprot:4838425-Alexandrium_andersonii.AAC.1